MQRQTRWRGIVGRWLVMGVVAGMAVAAVGARRPLEDFARLPTLSEPVLSPSGHAVATMGERDGQTVLAILPLDGRPRRGMTSEKIDINWFRWVNDDWLAVGVGQTVLLRGEEYYARRVMRVSADLETQKLIAPKTSGFDADDLIWTATDGSARVLIGRQTSIYWDKGLFPEVISVDLATGEYQPVVKSMTGVWNWGADHRGIVRAGIGRSSDGRNLKLVYREAEGADWRTVDRANRRRGERLTVPSVFLKQPGKALVFADADDGLRGVFEMDLETLELGKPLFVREGYDVSSMVRLPDSELPVGYAVWEDTLRYHWRDPDLAQVQQALDKAMGPSRRATIRSISQDRARMIVLVDSASEPGRWYVLDRVREQLTPLGWVNEAFQAPLHPVKTIRYKARDGLEIPAVLTVPKGREGDRGLPLIVMPHGGPQARDTEDWDWWAQFLADRGYVVVQPNFRGSTGYGRAFLDAGDGQLGLAMQDDLNDAVAHLAKVGLIDPARVCIVGGSYGGYAAMRAAQRDGELYRCAVSFAGVSDLTRLLRFDRAFFGGYMADIWKDRAPDLAGVSPLNFPEEVSIPVLIIHGKKDARVPVSQSKLFAGRLARHGKPHRYVEQQEGDHHLSREADRVEFLRELEAFLKEHNPA